MDYPNVSAAMDAVVKLYEHKLKELNPSVGNITYDITDLYKYLDTLKVCILYYKKYSLPFQLSSILIFLSFFTGYLCPCI